MLPTLDDLNLLATLPLLTLTGWAVLLVVLDLYVPEDKKIRTAWLAVIALVSTGVVLGLQAAGIIPTQGVSAFNGLATADGYALFMQGTFLLTTLLGVLLAMNYLPRRGIERGEYYTLLLFTTVGMMLMALANDLILVFLALELLSIPLYILSGFDRENPRSEEAALKYFLLGAFSSAFFVFGVALTYGGTATTALEGIAAALAGDAPNPIVAYVGMGLLLVGLGFKVAAVPFHMWTPDVYEGAPTPATAFMSVGAKAGGFAAMIRVFVVGFPGVAPQWGALVAIIAIATMIVGNVIAISQDDLKRMLGYSSIAHEGYILMAVAAAQFAELVGARGTLAVTAPAAAAFYLFTYTFTNIGAFGVVMAVEKDDGTGTGYEDFAGLGQSHPMLAIVMLIFMLSLTGIPLTAGFLGKFFVFQSAIAAVAAAGPVNAGLLLAMVITGALTSVVSAYYYIRVVIMMYFRDGEGEAVTQPVLTGAIALTGVATVLLGIVPAIAVGWAEDAVLAMMGG
ncbi:MAG: NADH-quinone oxidoreductase subunit N [Chloroflexi bacterium]|nr:NADH-quinone oxidoreductase subunit N [Chloroflexota bacterium]